MSNSNTSTSPVVFAKALADPTRQGIMQLICCQWLSVGEIVEAVGGFDPELRTCEDWDLWQRVARTGVKFSRVPRVLAPSRMRANSASMDGRRILEDGLKVLHQGYEPDPRF